MAGELVNRSMPKAKGHEVNFDENTFEKKDSRKPQGSASSSAVKTHKASSSGTTTASETSGFNSRPLGATVVVTTDTSPEKPSLGTALEETNLFNFSSVDCELLDLSASSFILRFWTDSGPTDFSEYTEWSHFEPEPNAVHVPGDVFVSRR